MDVAVGVPKVVSVFGIVAVAVGGAVAVPVGGVVAAAVVGPGYFCGWCCWSDLRYNCKHGRFWP